jgi:hypothetical protein
MPNASYWIALPPLPLREVGSAFVESLEHYVARTAWTAGISGNAVLSMALGSQTPCLTSASGLIGPSPLFATRLVALERLIRNPNLRCGTFYVLKDVLTGSALGKCGTQQRWCPECLADWDCQNSYEPLAWSIDALTRCPMHNCDIENVCRRCDAIQQLPCLYERRRFCRRCNYSLAGLGRQSKRPEYLHWIDSQVQEIVRVCATPGQEPIASGLHDELFSGLLRSARRRAIPPAIRSEMHSIERTRKSGKMTFRTLFNLCALQGVSIRTLLLSPDEATSEPMFDYWSGFHSLNCDYGRSKAKIEAFSYVCACLLARPEGAALVPTMMLLRAIKLNRDVARDRAPETYHGYESAYRAQASGSNRLAIERAFRVAKRCFANRPLGNGPIIEVAQVVYNQGNVSCEIALSVSRGQEWMERAYRAALAMHGHSALAEHAWMRMGPPERTALRGSGSSGQDERTTEAV